MLGKEATIRAYGAGNNFVESSIDLNVANGAVYGSNPPAAVYAYPVSPYPVNPYARNPYGYPANPPPYGYPNSAYPNGYPNGGYPNGYPNGAYPPPSRPWWSKIF